MTQNRCERCTRPLTDTAYVCAACVRPVAEDLASVPSLAEELPAARYRQTRYGSGGLGGWQEPWDDRAREVEHAVTNTLTTVARDVAETRGIEVIVHVPPLVYGPLCSRWCGHESCFDIRRTRREPCTWVSDGCQHGVCISSRNRWSLHPTGLVATWLVGQLDWIRHQRGALETLDELRSAVRELRHVVDRPADREIAGQCACGEYLYAVRGSAFVTCAACGTSYDVAQIRELLSRHIEQMLLTAAEIASLAVYTGLTTNRERVRKLVNVWSSRGIVVPKGDHAGQPTYRAGEVMTRLTASLAQSEERAG